MDVAVVTVGDELLAGDIPNTNATWLCDQLADRGVDVRRVIVVPDERVEIARVLERTSSEYDATIVTGGVGPTHDDVTMDAVAAALDRELVIDETVAQRLEDRGYDAATRTDQTAALPAGARAIHNEVGVAPGAVIESIYVFPGVPDEMQAMFEQVADEFQGHPRHTALVTAAEPESQLIDRLATVRDRFDVTIGSYPGENVQIKITGTDPATVTQAADWLQAHVDSPVDD